MKVKNYVMTLVFALICVCCMSKEVIAAGGACGTKATWDYNNGVLTISGTGTVEQVPWRAYDDYITQVVIKEGITKIDAWNAFQRDGKLASVSLPDSLTYIAPGTFEFCTALQEITIPKNLTSCGAWCFIGSGVKTVTFAEGMKSIPAGLFEDCTALTTIHFPKSLTEIEHHAFSDCTGLTEVTLPYYVKTIGCFAFKGCTSLEKITMYQNVKDVYPDSFEDVKGMTIYGKKNSTAHKFAKKNGYSFAACKIPALKGITYTKGNLKYRVVTDYIDGKGTVMVTGMKKNASSVTVPKTVKLESYNYKIVKINSKAFYKKSKLKKITIQSTTITSIGKNAFKGINKKAVIKVPKSKYSKYKKLLTSKTGFAKKTMKIKK